MVELLLKKGLPVDLMNKKVKTPLHEVAFRAAKKIVELLLENGAVPDKKDLGGMTPFEKALWSKDEKTIDLFVCGKTADRKSASIFPALKSAVSQGRFNTLEKYRKKGISLFQVDENGKSLLHFAARGADYIYGGNMKSSSYK